MEEVERLIKQKELIEYIGRTNEKQGFRPVSARILGLLLVMDKEEYTFEEIIEEMKISKSAASTALRSLEESGIIEYVTYPCDRKHYFRASFTDVDGGNIMDGIKRELNRKRDMITQIINLKKDSNSRNAIFLRNAQTAMDFFIMKIDDLKTTYKTNN